MRVCACGLRVRTRAKVKEKNMSLHYYSGSNQIPGETSDYKFELPKYGPSTTDPTFYEPTATRIANMMRSASSLQGIYDFTEKIDLNNKSKEEILAATKERSMREITNGVVDVRFSKHGLTKEEISQITMEKSLKADSMLDDKKKSK